jgi:hypothetical protein
MNVNWLFWFDVPFISSEITSYFCMSLA